MNYIIFDLEFNQSLNSKKENKNLTNLKCPFEIIQIGAVKLDENFQVISTIDKLVKPKLYTVMNPFVEEMTGIKIDILNKEQSFKEVYKDFLEFIGNNQSILCVWGACDIKELFRNIEYHNLDASSISKNYINIQWYASKYLNYPKGTSIGLKNAAELLNINIENKFHNALNDAYYTAEVFKKIPKKNVTIIKYDINKNMRRVRNTPKENILDISKLIKQFEKMFNRKMSDEEQKIIKLAYMMGKTRQFEIPYSNDLKH
ncbi:3'-5' exonuclease [Clostridium drakei]|uniref:Exonuclease n=1 Tax=Clostridium drakei TaxID=332101 RepID=A0A2U8DSF0_9CLOT|nr:3'-5' exonuclease [Clostridium drakei]AWI05401.1 exonuclease [Clostridium drakei]